jgi:lactate dehydrogenase-like 2-hydroxyacid dehydrogenase
MSLPSPLPRILQLGALMPSLEAELDRRYAVQRLHAQPDAQAFLAEHGAGFDGVVTSAFAGLDAATLAQLSKVRVVSCFGVGVDKVDIAATRARGIPVGYTPDVLNDCVADLAFGLLIDVSRAISASDRFVRAGQWTATQRFPLTTRVSGKRLGILGLGRIGQAIARRARGFDMTVRYTNRRPVADLPDGLSDGFEPDLLALADWADHLVVATAGGDATHHLVDRAVLQALGPRGFLINIARGSVVDEAALVAALQAGEIAGAGLDVFADEPDVPQALLGLDNVVLQPHAASATHETRQAMAERTLANLDAFFAGRPMPSQF